MIEAGCCIPGCVLETGAITLEGPVRELLENAELKAAYLGG